MAPVPATLDDTFQALADPTRRALISRLRKGASRVTDLAEGHAMSLNAVSKHIKVLENAGLVERQVAGREHYIVLAAEPLAEAESWLSEYRVFWQDRLERLDHIMKDR